PRGAGDDVVPLARPLDAAPGVRRARVERGEARPCSSRPARLAGLGRQAREGVRDAREAGVEAGVRLFGGRVEKEPAASVRTVAAALVSGLLASAPCAGAAWITHGPAGAVVVDLAADPQSPAVLHAATTLGLFRTTDGGASWTLESGLPAGSVTAVEVDRYRP